MAKERSFPIGIELVKRGLLKEEDVAVALEYQKNNTRKKMGDIINILNLCPEDKLIVAMSEILDEKFIKMDMNTLKVNMTEYISLDIAKENKAILFDVIGNKAKVCFADTSNVKCVEQIKAILMHKGLILEKYMSFENKIQNVLRQLGGKASEKITDGSSDIIGLVDTIIKSDYSIGQQVDAVDYYLQNIENYTNDITHIEGTINRLTACTAMYVPEKVDLEFAIESLKDFDVTTYIYDTLRVAKMSSSMLADISAPVRDQKSSMPKTPAN